MTDQPELIWRPTGERLEWNGRRAFWGPVRVENIGGSHLAWHMGVNTAEYHGVESNPQAALDALADRLREFQSGLSAVLGTSERTDVAFTRGYRQGVKEAGESQRDAERDAVVALARKHEQAADDAAERLEAEYGEYNVRVAEELGAVSALAALVRAIEAGEHRREEGTDGE